MLTRWVLVLLAVVGCSEGVQERGSVMGEVSRPRPSVALITLDTLRADALGHEGGPARTPTLDALASEGLHFEHAYTTAPTTLPAHTSMFTGLYPAAHGIHENGRRLQPGVNLVTERMHRLGYSTAAFVSGYPLARRFGLDRGFDLYDDDFAGGVERVAGRTTDKVIDFLAAAESEPVFLWVHLYDPHDPYEPPEPFAGRWRDDLYYGEVEYLDRELGRLVEAVRSRLDAPVIIVAGDHGEGLGDHGEQRHGNLLYQGVMRVPLLVTGATLEPGAVATPVSTRRVFHTILDLAGVDVTASLIDVPEEVVAAEAMKPYLQYGWQPQVMAVSGNLKAIQSGSSIEVFDVLADPQERHDLAGTRRPNPEMIAALQTYPVPSGVDLDPSGLSEEEQRKLAALGYVTSSAPPEQRVEAPNARDMTGLFADLDRGSALFVQERWQEAIAVFERVARQDPQNLMVQLRLAVAHSLSGRPRQAEQYFGAAERIAPESTDRKRYLALHYCRFGELGSAEEILDPLLPELSGNVAALECLAEAHFDRSSFVDAARLLTVAARLQPDSAAVQVRLGEARMAVGETAPAIEAFEAARRIDPAGFDRNLELGVLYLAAGRTEEAAHHLDSVPTGHPGYPMALFKRAQVSVLLHEPDRESRIRAAREHADATTRALIESESLFRGVQAVREE